MKELSNIKLNLRKFIKNIEFQALCCDDDEKEEIDRILKELKEIDK